MYITKLNDGITIKTAFPIKFFDMLKHTYKPFEIRVRRDWQSEMVEKFSIETNWVVEIYFRSTDREYFLQVLDKTLKNDGKKGV